MAYGARVSLIAGLGAAVVSVAIGLVIGVIAGWFRSLDGLIMRTMDAIMAIPGILLAIALVSVSGASLTTVLVAITIPEIPRVVRLVRGQILTVRGEPYVEAALALGTPLPKLLWRHMVPSTIAPLTVQGTYVFASAMLTEAILSFWRGRAARDRVLGQHHVRGPHVLPHAAGPDPVPRTVPVADRAQREHPGDALRDALDPKMVRRT